MTLSLYREGQTRLHRLNPTVKLVAFSLLILAPALFLDPATPATFLLLAFLLGAGLGGISPLVLIRRLTPFLLIAGGLTLFNTLFYAGPRSHLLLTLGPLTIWAEGLSVGASIGLRILCVVAYSSLFVYTTDPTVLVASLIHQAHLPYRLGYTALAAYRFLPILQRELLLIRNAHSVRGAYDEHRWGAWLGRVRRYGIPLLANGIRQAERLALAMDARGFGALSLRTYYVQPRLLPADYLFLVGTILTVLIILLGLVQLGLLRGFLAGAAESLVGAGKEVP